MTSQSTTTATRLPLIQLRRDGGTQPRAQLDAGKINEYAEAMDRGDTFPPVDVYYDGEIYWLADGFHRAAAEEQRGGPDVAVIVKSGTQRDAVLHSCGANARHGLPRSNDDKRRAVQRLLEDEEWTQWSDRRIAQICGVSNGFVSQLRKELSVYGTQIADSDTRKVVRGGSEYAMKITRSTAPHPDRVLAAEQWLLDLLIDGPLHLNLLERKSGEAEYTPAEFAQALQNLKASQEIVQSGHTYRLAQTRTGSDADLVLTAVRGGAVNYAAIIEHTGVRDMGRLVPAVNYLKAQGALRQTPEDGFVLTTPPAVAVQPGEGEQPTPATPGEQSPLTVTALDILLTQGPQTEAALRDQLGIPAVSAANEDQWSAVMLDMRRRQMAHQPNWQRLPGDELTLAYYDPADLHARVLDFFRRNASATLTVNVVARSLDLVTGQATVARICTELQADGVLTFVDVAGKAGYRLRPAAPEVTAATPAPAPVLFAPTSAELNAHFDHDAITLLGDSDTGAWHRAIEVARKLVAAGRWDGQTPIDFDAVALHHRLFGIEHCDPAALVEGADFSLRPRPVKPAPVESPAASDYPALFLSVLRRYGPRTLTELLADLRDEVGDGLMSGAVLDARTALLTSGQIALGSDKHYYFVEKSTADTAPASSRPIAVVIADTEKSLLFHRSTGAVIEHLPPLLAGLLGLLDVQSFEWADADERHTIKQRLDHVGKLLEIAALDDPAHPLGRIAAHLVALDAQLVNEPSA